MRPVLLLPLALPLPLLACWPGARVATAESIDSTVLIVSMDGFRHDYLDAADTPNFDRLVAEGVSAEALIPAFPSKTFPNHYSIATGLYPDHHGIVDNYFYDPERDEHFEMTDAGDNADPEWFGGEPIWVTAELQGVRAATLFWVGSEAPVAGVQATDWLPYDGTLTYDERIEQVFLWLDRPEASRPRLITLYFAEPDGQGHSHGPESAEVENMVETMDGHLGDLIEGLEDRELMDQVDLFVVSDHGMAGTSDTRLAYLDDHIDTESVPVENWGPLSPIRPVEAEVDAVVAQLTDTPHMSCHAREALPARLHYGQNPRVAPVLCIAESGYSITTRAWAAAYPDWYDGGTHGYDNQDPAMHGIFVGRGPHLAPGRRLQPFENIEIYNLMAHILALDPAENDGALDRVRGALGDGVD